MVVWSDRSKPNPFSTADPHLKAAYAPFGRLPTFTCLGDSITNDAGHQINASPAADPEVYPHCWEFWGQLLADSRATWIGSFGAGGKTIRQIKDTYLPYLLAQPVKPAYCTVLMGQNNLGALSAQDFADYTSVIDALRAAEIKPILATCTPGTTGRAIHAMNAHVRKLAAAYGLPLLDFYAAVIDPSTGAWKAALTVEGVHPNASGARVMGQVLADLLIKLIPDNAAAAWLPKTAVGVGEDRATQTGGNTNPLLLAADAGDLPDHWQVMSGWYSGITALNTSPSGGVIGNQLTLGCHGEAIIRHFGPGTVHAGDQVLVAFRVGANVVASNGNWGFAVIDSNGVSLYDVGRNTGQHIVGDCSPGIFITTVTGTAAGGIYLDFILDGSGSTLTLSEVSMLNLTALAALA